MAWTPDDEAEWDRAERMLDTDERRLVANPSSVSTEEALTCPVTDEEGGSPCGKPASEYPLPLGVTHIACPKHRLVFLAILGNILDPPVTA